MSHVSQDSPFAFPSVIVPLTKAIIKRRFARAACWIVRAGVGKRANAVQGPRGA